jgi:hypothetical protein
VGARQTGDLGQIIDGQRLGVAAIGQVLRSHQMPSGRDACHSIQYGRGGMPRGTALPVDSRCLRIARLQKLDADYVNQILKAGNVIGVPRVKRETIGMSCCGNEQIGDASAM